MSNNKQTSVEHIENAIQKYMAYYEGHYKAELFTIIELNEAVKEAKEMHKQEIIDAVDGFPLENRNMSGVDYYEKTYGGNNE